MRLGRRDEDRKGRAPDLPSPAAHRQAVVAGAARDVPARVRTVTQVLDADAHPRTRLLLPLPLPLLLLLLLLSLPLPMLSKPSGQYCSLWYSKKASAAYLHGQRCKQHGAGVGTSRRPPSTATGAQAAAALLRSAQSGPDPEALRPRRPG